MYAIQASNAEHVTSIEDLDVEAQSLALPPKALLRSHDTAQVCLPHASVLENTVHKFSAVPGPESPAGSELHTRSSSPSDGSQSDASYSVPCTTHSNATSRPESSSSLDASVLQHASGHDSDFFTRVDTAAVFAPKSTKGRELIAPKPWLHTSLPKAPVGDELSGDDEIDQPSAPHVDQTQVAEHSASQTHSSELANAGSAIEEWMGSVTTATPRVRVEDTPKNRRRGRRTIVAQKHLMQAAIIGLK